MKQLKQKLMQRAIKEHKKIQLIPYKTYDECFKQEDERLYFWFKSEGGNLHIISEEVE